MNRIHKLTGVAAGVALLLLPLAGCSTTPADADPAESTETAELGEVASIDELVDAFKEAGGECDDWDPANQVAAASESGNCSDATVLMVFDSEASRDSTADTLLSFGDVSLLIGPNWVINSEEVFGVLGALGGEIKTAIADSDEPAEEPEPSRDTVARQDFSGTGDMVQDIGEVTGLAVVTFSCPACESNTVVKSNGEESLLVNEIGAYSGSHVINLYENSMTTRFEIEAKGAWTLVLDDISTVPSYPDQATGTGDAVFWMTGSFTAAEIKNDGDSNFTVKAYGTDESPLIVNEIGAYSGVKAMSGPALVQVNSSGAWSIVGQ